MLLSTGIQNHTNLCNGRWMWMAKEISRYLPRPLRNQHRRLLTISLRQDVPFLRPAISQSRHLAVQVMQTDKNIYVHDGASE